jgi:hypothetical protein
MSGEFDLLGVTSMEEAVRRVKRQFDADPGMTIHATATFLAEAELANTDPEAVARLRATLAAKHGDGNVFDFDQLLATFWVGGFCKPYLVARRKEDSRTGTLRYTDKPEPRLYYDFVPHAG